MKETPFTTHEIQLQNEDKLYFFSDGFADQFGGNNSNKFMTKNFKKLLLEIYNCSMQEQFKKINKKYYDWKGNNQQIDDILILGIKLQST